MCYQASACVPGAMGRMDGAEILVENKRYLAMCDQAASKHQTSLLKMHLAPVQYPAADIQEELSAMMSSGHAFAIEE